MNNYKSPDIFKTKSGYRTSQSSPTRLLRHHIYSSCSFFIITSSSRRVSMKFHGHYKFSEVNALGSLKYLVYIKFKNIIKKLDF